MDENKIHEKAVKLRKMTDQQLVQYVENRVNKALSEGYNKGSKEKEKELSKEPVKILKSVAEFITYISQNPIKGVGVATVSKLMRVATENGFM